MNLYSYTKTEDKRLLSSFLEFLAAAYRWDSEHTESLEEITAKLRVKVKTHDYSEEDRKHQQREEWWRSQEKVSHAIQKYWCQGMSKEEIRLKLKAEGLLPSYPQNTT